MTDAEEKFEEIVNSNPYFFIEYIVPELEGYNKLKEMIFLVLLTPYDETPTQRDRLHLLMYGEPGTGKTVVLKWLHRVFDAEYLTQDTTIASLKGDARKNDFGVKILQKCNKRIICFDEFSLLKGREELRDAMEDGFYKIAKGGRKVIVPAEVRVVAATNEVKLSEAMQDRFDFTVEFQNPTPDLSKRIAKKLTRIYAGYPPPSNEELRDYVDWLTAFTPRIPHDIITSFDEFWEHYFDLIGIGWHGRKIASILRIAKAIARMHRRDVLPEDLVHAITLKEDLPNPVIYRLKKIADNL